MKTKRISQDDARKLLVEKIEQAGSQRSFAISNGINQAYISLALRGRQDLGPKVLAVLGLRKIIEFEREVSE